MNETAGGFAPDEARALAAALDAVIPANASLPGAGALGLASAIDASLTRSPALRPVLAQGLRALEASARARGAAGFAALPEAERNALLEEVSAQSPGFIGLLYLSACAAYYADARVVRALGLDPGPPHPRGREMQPTDFAILEPVRARGRIYR